MVVILVVSSMAPAADSTWNDTAGNDNWNDAGNWSAGVPGTGDTATFDATGPSPIDMNASVSIGALDFSAAAFTINAAGGTLTIDTAAGITTAGAFTDAIAAPITLGISQTFTVGSTELTMSGIIGDGGNAYAITKAGAGTLALNAANTYTGGVNLNVGTITLAHISGMGGGSVTAADGTFLGASVNLGAVANDIAIAGGGTLTINGPGNMQLGGVISGAASNLTINTTAAGDIITLSNVGNSYNGATTITQGVLLLGASGAIADGSAVDVTANGTFNMAGFNETIGSLTGAGAVSLGAGTLTAGGDGTSTTYSGVMTGAGGLTKLGAGVMTLSGANTYTGPTTITTGTLQIAVANDRISNSSAVTLGAAGIFDLNAFDETIGSLTGAAGSSVLLGGGTLTTGTDGTDTTFAGVISEAGNFVKTGGGTMTISGANSYTGTTTIDGGILRLGAAGVITDASAVTVDVNGTLSLNNNAETIGSLAGAGAVTTGGAGGILTAGGDGTSTTYSGIMSGTGALSKLGAGTLTLSGDSTYTGGTTLAAGGILLGHADGIGDGAVAVTGASTLGASSVMLAAVDNNIAITDGITLTINGTENINFSGDFTDVGGGNTGAVTITTGAEADLITFSGTNSYGGATTITTGTLIASGGAAIDDTSAVNLTGGATATFQLSTSETIGSLAGTANSAVVLGANTLTAGGDNTATVFDGVMSGAGNFAKEGTGLMDIGGVNTYTGTTNISGGGGSILQLGASGVLADTTAVTVSGAATIFDINDFTEVIGSLAGDGLVTLGSGTLTAGGDNTDTTYSGVMSETGNFAKAGTGTMIISGANTYTGTTTITGAGGVLQLGASGVLADTTAVTVTGATTTFDLNDFDETIGSLAGTGLVDLGSATLTTGGDGTSTAYSGIMSGTGVLTKTGAGTMTVSGANTYSGLTNIVGGTLSIGAINHLGAAGSGITFNNGGILTITAAIGAPLTDAIAMTGAGTVNTTFANELSGIISGAGALTKTGAGGRLTLTGINTYDGGTTVTSGILAGAGGLVDAAPLQGAIAIAAGAELDFVQAANATYDGVITGAGTLTKSGAAVLTMTGVSGAFTGDTDLDAGTLWINGTLGGTGGMVVAGAATLGGTGTYTGNVVVNAAGIVAPGNSIGELTVANYNPAAASILNVEVDLPTVGPPAADLLTVTAAGAGSATIAAGALVDIDLLMNIHLMPSAANTYNIIQTTGVGGTVVGTFDALSLTPAVNPVDTAIFQHSLTYTATTVNYVLNRNTIQSLALTSNQRAVGTALEARIRDAGDMLNNVAPIINGYAQAAQVRTALNQISPASLDVSTGATLDNARRFNDGLTEQLRRYHVPGSAGSASGPGKATKTARAHDDDMPLLAFGGNNDNVLALMMEAREQKRADRAEITEGPLKVWVRQFNNWSDEDAENDIPGYENFTTGVAVGGDIKIGDNLAVGVAIGYSNTDIDLTGGFGEGEIDSLRGSIYATWFKGGAYADAVLGFGNNWYENTRNLPFINRKATSDHTGQEYSAYLGGGYDFLFFGGYVGPTVSVQYTGLSEESYNESGAGALNQNIDSRDSHSLQTAVGLRYLHPIKLPDEKTTLVPEVRAKWLHEFMNDRDVSARFSGGGAAYTVDGNNVEKNSALLGGRLTAYLNDSISLYADYELQLQGSGGQTGHTVSAGLRIAW